MNHPKDRELSQAEKAQIIGFWRQCQNVLMIMGIMELRQDSVEDTLQNYFGCRLIQTVCYDTEPPNT